MRCAGPARRRLAVTSARKIGACARSGRAGVLRGASGRRFAGTARPELPAVARRSHVDAMACRVAPAEGEQRSIALTAVDMEGFKKLKMDSEATKIIFIVQVVCSPRPRPGFPSEG